MPVSVLVPTGALLAGDASIQICTVHWDRLAGRHC